MSQEFFTIFQPVGSLGRNRKTLTLAKAGSISVAYPQHSLLFDFNASELCLIWRFITTPIFNRFTFEAWIKPSSGSGLSNKRFPIYSNGLFEVYLTAGLLSISLGGTTPGVATSTTIIPTGSWTHIAIVWDGQDVSSGGNLLFYINGELAPGKYDVQTAFGGGVQQILIGCNGTFGPSSLGHWTGNLAEIRVWSGLRSASQINFYKNKPLVGSYLTQSAPSGLIQYLKLNDGGRYTAHPWRVGERVTLSQDTSAVQFDGVSWSNDYYPLRYGASWIAGKYDCVITGPASLKFPVKLNIESNFGLAVSWIDEDTGILQRKVLFTPETELGRVIYYDFPSDYDGEVLPTNFTIEVWNIDGGTTVDITEDIMLYLSKSTVPNRSNDGTNQADVANLSINDLLAPTNLTLPLTFNILQSWDDSLPIS